MAVPGEECVHGCYELADALGCCVHVLVERLLGEREAALRPVRCPQRLQCEHTVFASHADGSHDGLLCGRVIENSETYEAC